WTTRWPTTRSAPRHTPRDAAGHRHRPPATGPRVMPAPPTLDACDDRHLPVDRRPTVPVSVRLVTEVEFVMSSRWCGGESGADKAAVKDIGTVLEWARALADGGDQVDGVGEGAVGLGGGGGQGAGATPAADGRPGPRPDHGSARRGGCPRCPARAGPELREPRGPDVVYLESHVGVIYLEKPAQVEEYRRIFTLIG